MKKGELALLFLAATVSVGAANDFYARPGAVDSYTVLWQRQGSTPFTQAPALSGGAAQGQGAETVPQLPVNYSVPFFPQTPSGEGAQGAQGVVQSPGGEAFPVGRLFEAELLTGVLATPLADTPVVAQSTANWCGEERCPRLVLMGTASFSANARALVRFDVAVTGEGKVYTLNGFAFDPKDRLFGLNGTVADIAPTLAADLLRAAVSGLSDWVQALNRQTQTQVVSGPNGPIAVSTFEAAPFWTYSLGRIGNVFALPQNSTQIVRALVKGAGERILVASFPPGAGASRSASP